MHAHAHMHACMYSGRMLPVAVRRAWPMMYRGHCVGTQCAPHRSKHADNDLPRARSHSTRPPARSPILSAESTVMILLHDTSSLYTRPLTSFKPSMATNAP